MMSRLCGPEREQRVEDVLHFVESFVQMDANQQAAWVELASEVRASNAPVDQVYHGNREHLRTSTLAELKWSRESRDKFSTYYRIGVKYY